MREDAILLVAEDDDGHFTMIEKNLLRAGITNHVIRFTDGQETLDFLRQLKDPEFLHAKHPCLLLLDIRMPKVDGMEVLEFLKRDAQLKKIPVLVLSTAGDPKIIEHCRHLGCSMFVVKPVEYPDFVEAIGRIGQFISIIEAPSVICCG